MAAPRLPEDTSSILNGEEPPSCVRPEVSSTRFKEYVEKGLLSEQLERGIPFDFCTRTQVELLDVIFSGADV